MTFVETRGRHKHDRAHLQEFLCMSVVDSLDFSVDNTNNYQPCCMLLYSAVQLIKFLTSSGHSILMPAAGDFGHCSGTEVSASRQACALGCQQHAARRASSW